MPLVVVVPLPLVSEIVVPSTTIFSFAPSTSPLTVKASEVIVCPASIGFTAAPPNTDTAGACVPKPAASVKVGFSGVAPSVGASFTGVTWIVETGTLVKLVPLNRPI